MNKFDICCFCNKNMKTDKQNHPKNKKKNWISCLNMLKAEYAK